MGKVNLILITLLIVVIGNSFSKLGDNLNSLNAAIDHSLLNLEQKLMGNFSLCYGIQKLFRGDVHMTGSTQTWVTPQYLLNSGKIDSIQYIPGVGDTVNVVAYYKNWLGNNSIAKSSHALLDFFITQPEGQMGYYTMDDGSGTVITDLSGSGYDGQLINMDDTNWIAGVNGSALEFDGSEDYVDLGTSMAQDYGDNITVATWMKVSSDNNVDWGNIITENSDNLGNQLTGFTLRMKVKLVGPANIEYEFEVTTLNGKEKVYLQVSHLTMDLLSWHYIAGVCDMKNKKLLVGVVDEDIWAEANIQATGMPAKGDENIITMGHIKGAPNGSGMKSGLNGSLDSMRTIADVMTYNQLMQLMMYDGIKVPKILNWSS